MKFFTNRDLIRGALVGLLGVQTLTLLRGLVFGFGQYSNILAISRTEVIILIVQGVLLLVTAFGLGAVVVLTKPHAYLRAVVVILTVNVLLVILVPLYYFINPHPDALVQAGWWEIANSLLNNYAIVSVAAAVLAWCLFKLPPADGEQAQENTTAAQPRRS
ncbi:MAG: hypothetical protein LBK60_02530 [Verrucomicrobiales bacterium]|jgi:hypothetical protein|nr:hypothetical protein [Verrucomicrobiales bacterium]